MEQEYELHDGLTTALELEWGIEFLKKWYSSRKGNALINYGASVCWLISDLHLMKRRWYWCAYRLFSLVSLFMENIKK